MSWTGFLRERETRDSRGESVCPGGEVKPPSAIYPRGHIGPGGVGLGACWQCAWMPVWGRGPSFLWSLLALGFHWSTWACPWRNPVGSAFKMKENGRRVKRLSANPQCRLSKERKFLAMAYALSSYHQTSALLNQLTGKVYSWIRSLPKTNHRKTP